MRFICLLVAVLFLSGCYSTKLPNAGVSTRISHGKSKASKKTTKPAVYMVRPSDTLYSIGRRFSVDYHVIARRNRLRSPYRIYVGQYLYITGVAPRSQALPVPRRVYKAPGKTAKRKQVERKRKRAKSVIASHKTKARGYAKGYLSWPVKGKITSLFGRRGSRMHDGIDISAKQGTPVHAADAGTVVYADHRLSGYGKLVIIRHARNLFTAYAHNQRNLVKKGARVHKGDMIARVGHTGRASGAHLHFEVRHGSTAVDPLAYLSRR